ncbi:uncharacterized protein BX663DRAFT_524114 [Cokeromyces recurvatus]|uniref:uncharacterized protein n=1 Tax=Cokeromyces recurvatus TaxID=90255 RepID=UPI00221F43E4|nr:uncharacterized protein BX663DRAFT_524114 [Cokeromyces recurvatus]KAI7898619.1 hypothetical protein BX663DRAFT_524114 [Cokeromyces recurvatus]
MTYIIPTTTFIIIIIIILLLFPTLFYFYLLMSTNKKATTNTLDMSDASIIPGGQSSIFDLNSKEEDSDSLDESLPIPSQEVKKSWTSPPPQQQQQQQLPFPILPELDIRPPSNWALIKGHTRYFLIATLKFIFRDNNLPLLINIVYHIVAARALLARPWKTVVRYLTIPPTPNHSNVLKHQINQTTSIAIDAFRTQGVFHLALGVLGMLALKDRRQSSERSALFVLTLSAIGQSWTHLQAYWKSNQQVYTLKALQEVGSSDIFIAFISSVALFKTIRRTGRLI